MGFKRWLASTKTPKAFTGVVVSKKVTQHTDREGDSTTRYAVSYSIDTTDGIPRERTITFDKATYDQVEVGNEIIKTVDSKPTVQLGTKRVLSTTD